MQSSLRDYLASLTANEIATQFTPQEALALRYDWRNIWSRPEQLEPDGEWLIWVILAGRGFGKTRTGAEWIRDGVERGEFRRIALIGRTAADVRDTMINGESGIMAVSPPWFRPRYIPSRRVLLWPNGAMATTYSAEQPDLLRGPQHDAFWMDEFAAYRNAQEVLDNLLMGLRIGKRPRGVITTTPRPRRVLIELVKQPSTITTKGKTIDNLGNLSPTFRQTVVDRYAGTTIGRQELDGELMYESPGALWKRAAIDGLRVESVADSDLVRVVVGVDPSTTSGENSAETGIVVAAEGSNGEYYVLTDASIFGSPAEWAKRAVSVCKAYNGDRIVAEVNNGGDLVEATIRTEDRAVPYSAVRASHGKITRAEPIAALYEQGKVHHVGTMPELEDQMCSYTGKPGETSPDRMDALVWAITELVGTTAIDYGPSMIYSDSQWST